MAALKRRLLSEMRHATPAVGDTPLTASATPMAMSVSGGRAGAGAGAGEAGGLVVGASADGAGAMLPPPPGSGAGCAVSDETSLDAFVRTTMSEDDASFKKNMAKRTAEVRKKQWWVHESSATAKGRAKHLALTAAEEPKLLKDICAWRLLLVVVGSPLSCSHLVPRCLCLVPGSRGCAMHGGFGLFVRVNSG